MSEEAKVTLGQDDGHKRRWGLSNILYRQEGRKISINTKVTAWTFGVFILAGSALIFPGKNGQGVKRLCLS